MGKIKVSEDAANLMNGSNGSQSTNKTVSLTFSKEAELRVHQVLAEAAGDDDRSISSLIVRILIRKEPELASKLELTHAIE